MTRLYTSAYGLTFENYLELEKAGKITRPITDDELGADPTRRHANTIASEAITETETVMPWTVDPTLERLGDLAERERRRKRREADRIRHKRAKEGAA